MHIWYIHPYGGGPGVGRLFRPWHLATEWAKQGVSSQVFVARYHHLLDKNEPLPETLDVDGVRYETLKARQYKGNGVGRVLQMFDFCRAMWGLRKRVGKDLQKPDVIIASSPHPFIIYPALMLARRFNAKLVFEVRDLWPLSITEMNGTSKLHPFVWMSSHAERLAYRKADISASLLAGVDRYIAKIGITPKRFLWVPNGIEAERTETERPSEGAGAQAADLLERWRAEGRFVLVYAGALGHPNAIDILIEAMQRLSGEKIACLIVGDGGLATEYRTQAEGMESVHFAGRVPKKQALWFVRHADAAYGGLRAFDAVFQYGISPNKLLDYLIEGVPVVLPTKAYKDPVTESGGGICVPDSDPAKVAEAILSLSHLSAEDRAAMMAKAQAYVAREFDYGAIAGNYLAALRRL